jgi:hypothetical protein
MAKKTVKKTVSKKAETKARVKRPSIVAVDTAKRDKLTNKSERYEIEALVDAKGRNLWCVKLDGFYVTEFDSIADAKKAYPNARILGGQGCAEAVKGRPEPVVEEPKPVAKPKASKAEESPEDRLARLKAAARKAWETRKANGWKHPKAKSEMLQKIDAQLAESRAISKKAREEFKAREAVKAEKRKALAVVKRVEKREADKRKGQPIGRTPAVRLPQLEAILGQAFTK